MIHLQAQDTELALFERAQAARDAAAALAPVILASRRAAEAAGKPIPRTELLRDSRIARLIARLETMPVIEQAKGIIISQSGCTPEAAFAILRGASQRSNVPIREIAARVVSNAAKRTLPDATSMEHRTESDRVRRDVRSVSRAEGARASRGQLPRDHAGAGRH